MQTVKCATRIAHRIQEGIVGGRAAPGEVLGSEQQLCQRYQVGRGTIREAARILEFRGVARMQRGPNGGLVVALPDAQLVSQSFCGRALLAGTTSVHLIEARETLGRVAARVTNPIIDVFVQCLDMLDKHVANDGRLAPLPSAAIERIAVGERRAGQISRKVLAQIMLGHVDADLRIGSEADLCRRYSISRSVAKQTVRLLEDAGIVHCRRGRGRGLFVSRPETRAPLRTMCPYLSARSVSAATSWQTGQLLNIESARLAARHANSQERSERLAGGLLAEFPATRTSLSLSDMILVDRSIEDLAANPILALMLESLKSYSALITHERDTALARFAARCAAEYFRHTRDIADAIAHADLSAAMQAQLAKNEFFHRRIQRELTSIY